MPESSLCSALVLCLSLLSLPSLAQTAPAAGPAAAPTKSTDAQIHPAAKGGDDYSKEPYVVLKNIQTVRFAADGTMVRAIQFAARVQSDAMVRQLGVLNFNYESDNERVDIDYVRVRKADGSVVVTPASNVLDMPSEVTRIAPLYSDLKEKQVPVKGLGVGDTLEYLVHFRLFKPLVPGQFWFTWDFPKQGVSLDESVEVRFPASKAVKVVSTGVQPLVSRDGTDKVYLWKTSQLELSRPPDPNKPESSEPKPPSIQITSFQNWQQIGSWYQKLQETQVAVTAAIQAKAAEITRNAKTRDEKIRAIYAYVSTQFRYIGLDFGIGRYQPHSADDVLSNEYGDCKDKHTLFAALLKAEGIEAWPVLISSGSKLRVDVPSLAQFDHVITVIPQGKGYLWLDSTPEIAPFGMLTANLRDKQALIIPATGEALLAKTPADPPFRSSQTFTANAKLGADGVLTGHFGLSLRGDAGVIFRAVFHQAAQTQWQQTAQQISYGLNFGGTVSNLLADNPTQTDKPFHYSYDYLRKDYSDWSEHRIGPPLPPIRFQYDENSPKPVDPIKLGSPGEIDYRATVQLPPGYTMQAPDPVNIVDDFAEYHAAYSVKNGIFTAERRFVRKQREVPLKDWALYIAMEKAATKDQNAMQSLVPAGAAASEKADAGNPQAEVLLQQAESAFRSHQLTTAAALLAQAKQLNPHQEYLQSMYGYLHMVQGDRQAAIASLNDEIRDHPQNFQAYRLLAFMLLQRHDEAGAMDVWRRALKASPGDTHVALILSGLLLKNHGQAEAIPILAKLVKEQPDNVAAQVMYGGAMMLNGRRPEGAAILEKAAINNPTPQTLTGVAMLLAESSIDLPLAADYAKRAVSMVETSTQQLTLDSISDSQLGEMRGLAAAWNAMAMVLFHTGDMKAAEHYANAAWMLGQSPIAGDLLGQIYEKQGRRNEAAHAYSLAIAAAQSGSTDGFSISDTQARLNKLGVSMKGRPLLTLSVKGKAHDAPVQIWRPQPWRGGDELGKLRSVYFSADKHQQGSADFYVLLSGGKPQDALFISGSENMRSFGATLLKATFQLPVPDNGPEKIVRRGILFCSEVSACQFAMLPLPATQ